MVHYSIDDNRQLLACYASGAIDFIAAAQTLQDVIEDATERDVSTVLWVFQDSAAIFSLTSLRTLLPLIQTWAQQSGRSRWAIVTPNQSMRAIVEVVLPGLKLGAAACDCFVNESDARRWLDNESTEQSPGVVNFSVAQRRTD